VAPLLDGVDHLEQGQLLFAQMLDTHLTYARFNYVTHVVSPLAFSHFLMSAMVPALTRQS
jgi:hypothetical protein